MQFQSARNPFLSVCYTHSVRRTLSAFFTSFRVFSAALFFALFSFVSSNELYGQEKAASGDGFEIRHDPAQYGEFLTARKIPDSRPSSGMYLHENWLYVTGYGHLTVYDVSDPRNPKETAQWNGVTEGRQIAFYKNHLYVTARTGGLYVLDVTDPAHPVFCSHYDTMELATGITCDEDVAYVSQRQFGTEFINISDPKMPRHLGFVLSGEAQSVDCANGILYAGDWGSKELSVIDVRNRKNAQIIGSGKLDGLGDGVYVRGDFCYAATGPRKLRVSPAEGHGLDVFCVKDPYHPILAGRFKFPAQAVHKFPDFWAVSVGENGLAYVADSFNGVFCLDVSDPASMKCFAHCVLPICERTGNPDPVGALTAGDGVIYAAGCQEGVYVIEAPKYAVRVSKERTCPALNTPVLADSESDENLARDFSILPTTGQALAAAVWTENRLWLAAGSEGLLLVDISDDTPKILRTFPTEGFAYDVKIDGDRLFTAEGKAGTAIYRIQPDGELKQEARMDAVRNSPVRQIVIPNPKRFAVTKWGNSNMSFYDISDPTNPREVFQDRTKTGILYGRDFVDGCSPNGSLVCVAQETGLIWYDLAGSVPQRRGTMFPGKVSFYNGGCWKDGKFFFFRGKGYYTLEEPQSFENPAEPPFHSVPDLPGYGKASAHGNEICFTDRREGFIVFLDVQDPENPKILRRYSLHGHPEIAVFAGNRAIIPAGHFGLLIEKKK